MKHWKITFPGTKGTPMEGGKFKMEAKLGENNYPYAPPKCKLATVVWNPCVSKSGEICPDLYENNWKPCFKMADVIRIFMQVVSEPKKASEEGVKLGAKSVPVAAGLLASEKC
jgi:ubiquitin-protein ligase